MKDYLTLAPDDFATAEWQHAGNEDTRRSASEAVDHVLGTARGVWKDIREERQEVTRTFAFIDIVGSTRLLDAIGDAAWAQLLSWHEHALGMLFEQYDGELVDQAGDGFFVSFDEPHAAIACAVAIQRVLAYHRQAHGFALEVRIGLHRAEVLRAGPAYRGKGIHVVARIAALAGGGEILASSEAVQASHVNVPASGQRAVELAGISEPVRVRRLEWALN